MLSLIFLVFLMLLCFSGLLFAGGSDLFSKAGIQRIKDKKEAPNFVLENLDGKKVEIKKLKGKVIFINFWATWCGPCKEEMPSIEGLHQQFKEKDFIFLTISVDYEGINPVKEYIKKYHYTFPVLLDPKCKALDLYQGVRIPATFIIDKKGFLVGKVLGTKNWKSPEIISLVNDLFKEK
jgi:thiol-disulfide isomerase/thioredoxin